MWLRRSSKRLILQNYLTAMFSLVITNNISAGQWKTQKLWTLGVLKSFLQEGHIVSMHLKVQSNTIWKTMKFHNCHHAKCEAAALPRFNIRTLDHFPYKVPILMETSVHSFWIFHWPADILQIITKENIVVD